VNLKVAEQGFSLLSMDDDIAYLIQSFEPATNAVLPKVDVDEILHATSTLDLWDILVVLVVMNKFDLRDAIAKYVNSYLHVGVNFC